MIKIYSCYCLFDLAFLQFNKMMIQMSFLKESCLQFCSGFQIWYRFDSITNEFVVCCLSFTLLELISAGN